MTLYDDILEYGVKKTSDSTRQIEQDLMRTFPSNKQFKNTTSPMIEKLHRVLVAYSYAHRNIGYCQVRQQL